MAEAELSTVARPYARAAFTHALEQPEGLSKWSTMLMLLKAVIEQPVVQDALDNPLLTTAAEQQLIVDLMGDDLSADGSNFIGILAEYDRLALIPTVADQFEHLKAEHEKTVEVSIASAFEVSESEKENLAKALAAKLQRDINIETTVDESLIGGVVIKAEDTVIDDSVKGRLTKLSQALS